MKSLLRRQYDRRGPAGLPPQADLPRRVAAEALGSALLLAIVIGSGIMGERLAGGNIAVALLGNTIATGAGLVDAGSAKVPLLVQICIHSRWYVSWQALRATPGPRRERRP